MSNNITTGAESCHAEEGQNHMAIIKAFSCYTSVEIHCIFANRGWHITVFQTFETLNDLIRKKCICVCKCYRWKGKWNEIISTPFYERLFSFPERGKWHNSAVCTGGHKWTHSNITEALIQSTGIIAASNCNQLEVDAEVLFLGLQTQHFRAGSISKKESHSLSYIEMVVCVLQCQCLSRDMKKK